MFKKDGISVCTKIARNEKVANFLYTSHFPRVYQFLLKAYSRSRATYYGVSIGFSSYSSMRSNKAVPFFAFTCLKPAVIFNSRPLSTGKYTINIYIGKTLRKHVIAFNSISVRFVSYIWLPPKYRLLFRSF